MHVPATCTPQTDELRTFESGGKYAMDNAAAYRRSLAAIDVHLDHAGTEQMQRLEAARDKLTGEVGRAGVGGAGIIPVGCSAKACGRERPRDWKFRLWALSWPHAIQRVARGNSDDFMSLG